MTGSSLLMLVMREVLFERLHTVQIQTISLLGIIPMSNTLVALMAQYLNVRRQRKLVTFIIQTVHILHYDTMTTQINY